MTPVFGKGPHMGVIEPIGIRKKPESLHLYGARAQILCGLGPNGLGASGSVLSSFVLHRSAVSQTHLHPWDRPHEASIDRSRDIRQVSQSGKPLRTG